MVAARRIALIACFACCCACCVLGGVAHAEVTSDVQQYVQQVVDTRMQEYTRDELRPATDALLSQVNRIDGTIKAYDARFNEVQAKLDAVDAQLQSDDAKVVLLDETQWATLRDCWHWGKTAAAVALFLALSVTLLVCVVIGQRLWDAFSRGWRS